MESNMREKLVAAGVPSELVDALAPFQVKQEQIREILLTDLAHLKSYEVTSGLLMLTGEAIARDQGVNARMLDNSERAGAFQDRPDVQVGTRLGRLLLQAGPIAIAVALMGIGTQIWLDSQRAEQQDDGPHA